MNFYTNVSFSRLFTLNNRHIFCEVNQFHTNLCQYAQNSRVFIVLVTLECEFNFLNFTRWGEATPSPSNPPSSRSAHSSQLTSLLASLNCCRYTRFLIRDCLSSSKVSLSMAMETSLSWDLTQKSLFLFTSCSKIWSFRTDRNWGLRQNKELENRDIYCFKKKVLNLEQCQKISFTMYEDAL